MENQIFNALDKNYINKLFSNKKFIYFPEEKNKKITAIKIKKGSPAWAKETCLAKYKIFFGEDNFRTVRGAAGAGPEKKKAWKIISYLFQSGFDRGDSRVPKPLDFINETNLFLYEEFLGKPLSAIIQEGNIAEIEDGLKKAAGWLAKLHKLNIKSKKFPAVVSFKFQDYKKVPIHNDFYPGNIIIDREIVCVIDFDKSGFGHRLTDVAALFGWFEFPDKIARLNFAQKQISVFQKIFLKEYCRLCELDYLMIRKKLNMFLAKIFLEQAYNYALMAVKGWDKMNSLAKDDYQEKIKALIQKAKQYLNKINHG